jgi:MFS transporter, ACS family, D-galactonate transporter
MLALLVISVAINYVDRGNLSIAAPLIKDELGISAGRLGALLSAFFWTYSFFQIVAGWLLDRYHPGWILAGGFALWSVATAATGLAKGFAMLLGMRLLLGIGEAVAYPCYSKILAARFREQERGIANSLIDAGNKCGPAAGTLAGGMLMARFGWRPFFVVLGIGSLLWIIPWLKWMPSHEPATQEQGKAPGVLEILSQPQAYATFAGHFCSNYLLYFLLTWLPFYLVRERHFSMDSMAKMGALAYMVSAVTTIVTGWISDRAIAAGASVTKVRKFCAATGLGLSTAVVTVTMVESPVVSMALLLFACMSYGIYSSSHWAITQTIAGPRAAGKWSGLQNFVANWAGIAAPWITGLAVERTGSFFWAFAIVAAVALVGFAIYLFALGKVEAVRWAGDDAITGSVR